MGDVPLFEATERHEDIVAARQRLRGQAALEGPVQEEGEGIEVEARRTLDPADAEVFDSPVDRPQQQEVEDRDDRGEKSLDHDGQLSARER